MKKLLARVSGVVVPVVMLGLSVTPAWAEREVRVTEDARGNVYTVDMDSLRVYVGSNGVTQVDFGLSTVGDDYWHEATASCNPYDVKSAFYKWNWSGSKSYPAGTVAGDIARAVCP